MEYLTKFKPAVLVTVAFIVGLLLSGASQLGFESLLSETHAQQPTTSSVSNARDAQTEMEAFSDHMPDQSHIMTDVGYHVANLWFAADKQNWPLANYYLGETRAHLRWAVRIHPTRKISTGAEVNLKGILDSIDNSFLSEVGKAITNKNTAAFKTAYRETLEGCYACHQACEKPFLRPQIPSAAGTSIINFEPVP